MRERLPTREIAPARFFGGRGIGVADSLALTDRKSPHEATKVPSTSGAAP